MEKEEELFIPKTKHKALKIIIGILLIIGLAAGGYFLYQYKFNNPKTIVSNIIKDAKSNVKKSLVQDTSSDIYKVDGHVKIDTNLMDDEEIKLLKDLELQFSGEIDSINSIGNIAINTKYKDDKLIDIKTYYEKNDVYLFLDGIYDKYLKINSTDSKNNADALKALKLNVNNKDLETIINSIIDAFDEEVNKLDINKTDATITIENEKIDVLDNYIELKDKEVNEFAKGIINNLSKDKNFSDALKKLTDKDIETILNDMIKGIDEETFKGIYSIHFYTDKGIFNKKLISVKQTIIQDDISLSFIIDKISDDEIKLSFSTMGVKYSIKIKRNNSVINLVLNMDTNGSYINMEISVNYEKIKEVTKPDLSNSKDIDKLTEEENNEINQKLSENKTLLKLIDRINKTNKQEA